ncbi:MAG: NAD-dependent epimerase/dehydratase family protein [Litoreibacter sp.]|nr:NAD-dependent epimerase/dehydratase family protein [Litoreibacter sp.]
MKDNEAAPKAVILGGTGHIGAAIARRFHEGGYSVLATGYREIARPNLDDLAIEIALGDDTDPAQLREWCTGAEVVVDCATPYPVWVFDGAARDTVGAAVARTRTVLEAVAQTQASFVLISSFTTLPRQESPMAAIRRGALYGSHPYFDLKAQVERIVQDHIRAGNPGAILAPSTVFGPYDLKERAQTFIPMLLSGKVPVLARKEMNIIDVRDVAEVAFAARHGQLAQPIPVFGHNVWLKELSALICEIGGTASPQVAVPSPLGAVGLYWVETAYAATGRKTPWPSLSMLLLSASYSGDLSPEQRRLHAGLRPIDDTLRDAVEWYARIGYL